MRFLASRADVRRIAAARLVAERLADWLMVWGTWNVYVDSVGAVVSEAVQVLGSACAVPQDTA